MIGGSSRARTLRGAVVVLGLVVLTSACGVPGTWTILPAPAKGGVPTPLPLHQIACGGIGSCLAVPRDGTASAAAAWDGRAWRRVRRHPSPRPPTTPWTARRRPGASSSASLTTRSGTARRGRRRSPTAGPGSGCAISAARRRTGASPSSASPAAVACPSCTSGTVRAGRRWRGPRRSPEWSGCRAATPTRAPRFPDSAPSPRSFGGPPTGGRPSPSRARAHRSGTSPARRRPCARSSAAASAPASSTPGPWRPRGPGARPCR